LEATDQWHLGEHPTLAALGRTGPLELRRMREALSCLPAIRVIFRGLLGMWLSTGEGEWHDQKKAMNR
jgi:hypothetical protein